MFWMAHYYMVNHLDFEKLTGADEVSRDLHVRLAWGRISTRVIVREHDRRCGAHDRESKYLAWMNKDHVHRAEGDQLMALYPAARIQEKDGEAFTLAVEIRICRNVGPPIGGSFVRSIAQLKFLRGGTFPERKNAILMGCPCKGEWFADMISEESRRPGV